MVRVTKSGTIQLAEREALTAYSFGALVTAAGAYYTGATGDPIPLMGAALAMGLLTVLTSTE